MKNEGFTLISMGVLTPKYEDCGFHLGSDGNIYLKFG